MTDIVRNLVVQQRECPGKFMYNWEGDTEQDRRSR